MSRESYRYCDHCEKVEELGTWLKHQREFEETDAPAFHAFQPYVDEHISVDGKPVFIDDASKKRDLLKNQWQGDHKVEIRERDDRAREADYRVRHIRDYLQEKGRA